MGHNRIKHRALSDKEKEKLNKQNNKILQCDLCLHSPNNEKKQPKSLLQQQITKKCTENKNAKAFLCIKIDQDFFENNLYIVTYIE